MKAQVVYETEESYEIHAGPHGYSKVGVLIDDRVIWLACSGYGMHTSVEEYRKWQEVANKIVTALNQE